MFPEDLTDPFDLQVPKEVGELILKGAARHGYPDPVDYLADLLDSTLATEIEERRRLLLEVAARFGYSDPADFLISLHSSA